MRKTKIICTIGHFSASASMIEKLAKAGMDCARLNFSHGTHAEHLRVINLIRKVSTKIGKEIAIMQDLPGSKLRVGKLEKGSVYLKRSSFLSLTTEDIVGNEKRIPVGYDDLPRYVNNGTTIFLSDGSIRLMVLDKNNIEIKCKCEIGGELLPGKGVNIPQLKHDFKTFTSLDKEHLEFGLKNDVDLVAVSFVRKASDIEYVRKLVNKSNDCSIIAKIEKKEAVDNMESIIEASDAVMVARGDLGVEKSLEQVPMIQKSIILHCNNKAIPVIVATQMLESMINNSTPTRAEVTDIATAILDGTDAVMLSDATAVGKYPVECVQMLHRVSLTAEEKMTSYTRHTTNSDSTHKDIRDVVCEAANQISLDIGAKLIISPTNSNEMALKISRFRPKAPIIALTDNQKTIRKLKISWGVYPIYTNKEDNLTNLLETSIKRLTEENLVKRGDRAVIICDNIDLSKQIGELLFVIEAK
ncbi:MAG: pyruvate kinase [Thaumarchaeota archaeon]|nr:pyruvate kinase [Nitrososphaerota archaeon]